MEGALIIRNATVRDATEIIEHTIKVLKENSTVLGTTLDEFAITTEQEEDWIKLHNQQGILLVTEINKNIIGILSFRLSLRQKYKHQGTFGMSIQQSYTNKGIGSSLLIRLLEWAKGDNRVEKISLEVFSNNKRAIHLYTKHGFSEEGRRKRHVKLGPNEYVDEILMCKFV